MGSPNRRNRNLCLDHKKARQAAVDILKGNNAIKKGGSISCGVFVFGLTFNDSTKTVQSQGMQ